MKVEFFQTLAAVLRCGSFAGAATEMSLSPSAVSLQMKQLETYFGQPLFDRSALQVRPTAFAHEVSATVQGTMDALETLRRRSAPVVEGRIRLGVIEPMQVTVLPGFTALVRESYPKLDVRLERGRSSALVDALRSGTIDAAVVAQPETGASTRIRWTPLFREPCVLVAPPDSGSKGVAALLKSYEWIRFDTSTIAGSAAADYVKRVAPEVRSRIELLSIPAIVAMASRGLGVSVLPVPDSYLLSAFPVRVLTLGDSAPSRQISFVSRVAEAEDRLVQALLDCVSRAVAARG
ncbi:MULTISPECIES: LysR family transcriptional regulator [unclassified Cupriavidus]|uniref:LysR family transcriptional regulator n=1 Tax=unclassified Cupriavidus TaxID=2640874 RepID=UPI000881AFC0|nr:LysR family transcriptional regulator [Cupriavidus sp. YR651]SDD02850.1 DNA-binding transcriptional regulator, LysR family [Cupriavidus sp. YR651]